MFTVYIAHCRTCPVESNYAQFSSSLKCLETLETLETVGISLTLTPAGVSKPIGSMYGIYGNIYHQYTPFMLAYIPAPWILWEIVTQFLVSLYGNILGESSHESFFVFHNPGELVSLHLVGLSHVYIYTLW